MPDFSNYLSTFSWRYASPEMRHVFSEEYKYALWWRIWVALAEAQHEAGLLSRHYQRLGDDDQVVHDHRHGVLGDAVIVRFA